MSKHWRADRRTAPQALSTNDPPTVITSESGTTVTVPMDLPTINPPGARPFPPPTQDRMSINGSIQFIGDLKLFRDAKGYESDGHPTFRSWTVANFGERLGSWIDENL